MGITEVEKIFGRNVIAAAEAFHQGEGLGPSDAIVDLPSIAEEESDAGAGGLYGFSRETAQRMGRRYLKWDSTLGWVPNTETLIDER